MSKHDLQSSETSHMKKPAPVTLGAAPPREGSLYRAMLGLVALIGGLLGLAGLYFVPIPEGNREPLLLALGLVLGWGSTVVGYEFGSSPAGRKAADAGVRSGQP
jgi:hypothetical protein